MEEVVHNGQCTNSLLAQDIGTEMNTVCPIVAWLWQGNADRVYM